MYGLVLLTAMTSSGADVTQAPISNPVPVVAAVSYGGCGATLAGCNGCYGSCYGSCNGCYGSGHGGLFHGSRHGLFGHHKSSCHGCGGCTGYSCSGWNCFGSCYGSCSGSAGGFSGCYGFGTLQSTPWQCHGGCYGGYFGAGSYSGPPIGGGWGYAPRAIYSDPYAIYGTVTTPPPMGIIPPSDAKPMDKPEAPAPSDKDKDKKKDGMGANLKFRVPADAKLYVDGRLMTVGGTERVFTTPPLLAGQKFYYDVKAEIVVDGKPVIEEKRVVLEAGTDLTESFTTLFTAIETKTIPVAGK